MRALLPLTLLLVSCSARSAWHAPRSTAGDEARRLEALAGGVSVHRDRWGVPHVEGPTDASVVFGLAYARAEDEFERMEEALFLTLGRNAEAGGEAGLVWDRIILALDVPGRAQAEYARMPAAERALCDAAADGLNWYLATHPELSPRRLRRFEPWYFLAAEYAFHLHQVGEATGRIGASQDGSNAWALAPSRTTSGRAMLLANPHIPLGQVYEAHLRSDEGLHVSGMLAYGRGLLPMIGFNERVAWSLTVNRPDTVDVYAVRFDHPEDPDLYRHGETWRRATERRVTVRVRDGEALLDRELVLRATHHGPILGEVDGVSYAVRVAALEGGMLGQWYAIARARDLGELKQAVGRGCLLFHNVVAADAQGHVWYVYNGAVPVREEGYDWAGVVDGNDPATDWLGLHPLADLPQVEDPPCGFVQSCNSRPWVTTGTPADPAEEDFPSYLVGPDEDDPRVPMSLALLGRAAPFTFEEWAGAAFDPTVHDPNGMLSRLLAESIDSEDERVVSAAATLATWDRRLGLDEVAPTLFFLWLERVAGYALSGDQLPPGVAAANLARVLDELERRYSSWRVPWGQLNRHQRRIDGANDDARPSHPCLGAHAWGGTTFCFLSRWPEGCNLRYGYHGNSYVAAVELGPDGPRARTILDHGQSSDPTSAHFDDQGALYARGETKLAPFTRDAVRAAAVRSYHPGQP
jgi:acyl-homoserine-lactone acylase